MMMKPMLVILAQIMKMIHKSRIILIEERVTKIKELKIEMYKMMPIRQQVNKSKIKISYKMMTKMSIKLIMNTWEIYQQEPVTDLEE